MPHISNLKEGKIFWRCKFHKAGCKEELRTYVGKAVDVTGTEHNHPPDQISNKAKKLVLP